MEMQQSIEEESKDSDRELVLTGQISPLGNRSASTSASRKGDDSQIVVVTPVEIKKAMEKANHTIYPVLITLGGLQDSKKTEFLANMLQTHSADRYSAQMDSQRNLERTSFSQNLALSSGFLSPSTKPQSAKVDNQTRLLYSFLAGIRHYYKMEGIQLEFSSTSLPYESVGPAFENSVLESMLKKLCKWLRSHHQDQQIKLDKRLLELDKMIHKELAVVSLWELTINRTSLRFLECFRGHLYNLHAWLFVDLDRDIDKLHLSPTPTPHDHPFAMQWRSRLHYLLRASCLAESKFTERAKVCQIFAIHSNIVDLESKVKKLEEEARNATAQYGLSDLFDFKIVPVNIGNEHEFKAQPYNVLLSYLHSLKAKEIPLSWTFLRFALTAYCDSSIFIRYSDICLLAKGLQFTEADVQDFLKYYTSYGDVLNMKLIDDNSEWVILEPAEFLKNLCGLLSLSNAEYGIITPAKASELLGKDSEIYFSVLISAGLASKLGVDRLTKELKTSCKLAIDTQYVYYMSVIRQGETDRDQTSKGCIQLVSGLKSPAMNMQIAFTNQLRDLLPEMKLSSSTQTNTTCLRIDVTFEIKIVVQADVIEIRFTNPSNSDTVDKVCREVVNAIRNIAELRAKRGGKLDYYLRVQCCGQKSGPPVANVIRSHQNYHILTKMYSCDECSSTGGPFHVHQYFKIAVEKMNIAQDRYYKDVSIITCDDAYSLAKEVKTKEDCSVLAKVLGVPDEAMVESTFPDDAIWFTAFSIILNWRKARRDVAASRHELAVVLLLATDEKSKKIDLVKEQRDFLRKMARNLDIQLYSTFMRIQEDKMKLEYRTSSPVMASRY